MIFIRAREPNMADQQLPVHRTWQDIAQELATETNGEKVTQLAEQLNAALLDEELSRRSATRPDFHNPAS